MAGTPVERRVALQWYPNAVGYKEERPGLGSLVIQHGVIVTVQGLTTMSRDILVDTPC